MRGCVGRTQDSTMPSHSSSSASPSDRISRLEHILGGKPRKNSEGTPVNIQANNHDNPDVLDVMVPQNSRDRSKVDHANVEEVGLETAMKQLMEATHDALLNMKGDIMRMQYDLERALVEINSVQHREELLQHKIEEKAIELEKDFSRQMRELQENVILEFKFCKEQTEKTMLEKLRLLVKERKIIQQSGRNSKGLRNRLPRVNESVLEHMLELRPQSAVITHSSDKENTSSNISRSTVEERATLTEAMLQRISQKRLEQSAAVVRGWLQSPTPSDASSIAPFENGRVCSPKRRPSNLSMCSLVTSVKEAALAHRCASSSSSSSLVQSKPSEQFSAVLEANGTITTPTDMLDVGDDDEETPKSCSSSSEGCGESPVSVLDDSALQDCKENLDERIFSERLPHPQEHPYQHQHGQKKNLMRILACAPAKAPALRILQPKNFKISDLLQSDSEEDIA